MPWAESRWNTDPTAVTRKSLESEPQSPWQKMKLVKLFWAIARGDGHEIAPRVLKGWGTSLTEGLVVSFSPECQLREDWNWRLCVLFTAAPT